MSKLVIHVGGGFADDMRRVLAAAGRAERGEPVEAESHVSFENWTGFFRVLTPARVEVLRHVYAHKPRTERALAHDLGRDYGDVHADIVALEEAGLIERGGALVTTEWDAERADIEAA